MLATAVFSRRSLEPLKDSTGDPTHFNMRAIAPSQSFLCRSNDPCFQSFALNISSARRQVAQQFKNASLSSNTYKLWASLLRKAIASERFLLQQKLHQQRDFFFVSAISNIMSSFRGNVIHLQGDGATRCFCSSISSDMIEMNIPPD